MKTLVSVLVAGALCATGAFAEAAGGGNSIATPHVPFRPLNKRPSGAQQTAVAPKALPEAAAGDTVEQAERHRSDQTVARGCVGPVIIYSGRPFV